MKVSYILVLAVLCIALISNSIAAPLTKSKSKSSSSVKETGNEFDFFLIVFQWAPAVCATSTGHQCVIPSQVRYWTLHGLWPSRNDTTYPSNCCSSCKFNDTAVADITTSLNNYWPNLFADEAWDSFYSHEYLKHGTCAANITGVNNEHDYFAKTLSLYSNFNVAKAFTDAGVIPSSSKGYTLATVTSAMKTNIGFNPYLTCSTHNSQQLITGLGFCLDKYTFQPFECATKVLGENNCKSTSNIFILPFN